MTLLLKNALTQKQITTLNYATSVSFEDDDQEEKHAIKQKDISDIFEKFTTSLRTAKLPQDYITLDEFQSLEFEREGLPEIIHDVLLYLADYKVIYNTNNNASKAEA